MEITAESLIRRYKECSDAELLSFQRSELTDLAKQIYDEELAHRGVSREVVRAAQHSNARHAEGAVAG
jgi:hypothetical protein